MKSSTAIGYFITVILGASANASASLIDRGDGLIYDTVLDITWLQDANYAATSGYDSDGLMSWNDAVGWAEQLVYGGFENWRLPNMGPVNGISYNYSWSDAGITDWGLNIDSPNNELGYMYYVNLQNSAKRDESGDNNTVFGLENTGPFINLMEFNYWSNNFYEPPGRIDSAFLLRLEDGEQHVHGINDSFYGWAVHEGDIATSLVPVPSAVWLFGSGIVGLIGLAKRRANPLAT